MTTDGINKTDWRSVKALAAKIANATSRNNDEAAKRGRASLLRVLDRLDLKYGPKASLLATRADYMINTKHRLRLLSEAYSIALGSE
ncbi:MAG: hypothetical protein LC114_06310, partial [Bryobacterales bacterium]|nr:hypothetical protein [Bryobacterales bacterium]